MEIKIFEEATEAIGVGGISEGDGNVGLEPIKRIAAGHPVSVIFLIGQSHNDTAVGGNGVFGFGKPEFTFGQMLLFQSGNEIMRGDDKTGALAIKRRRLVSGRFFDDGSDSVGILSVVHKGDGAKGADLLPADFLGRGDTGRMVAIKDFNHLGEKMAGFVFNSQVVAPKVNKRFVRDKFFGGDNRDTIAVREAE